MRKLLMVICLLLLTSVACAEEQTALYTGVIHESLPEVEIRVYDMGENEPDSDRPYLMAVEISAIGLIRQGMMFQSLERPREGRIAPLARLEDANFDGYADLWLLKAQGARNVFWSIALWDVEEQIFREPLAEEWCNPVLDPQDRQVLSSVADGYAYCVDTLYGLEGQYSYEPDAVCEIYDAGEGLIGETLRLYGTGMERCWDQVYPETWYYGQEGVYAERRRAIREMMQGRASWDGTYLQVANVDWVNLRLMDSKQSTSIAKLDAGTPVILLEEGIGPDQGWVRVFYRPEGDPGIFVQRADDGGAGLTGYIWHSFLEPVPVS